jgi:hypothetical protein
MVILDRAGGLRRTEERERGRRERERERSLRGESRSDPETYMYGSLVVVCWCVWVSTHTRKS